MRGGSPRPARSLPFTFLISLHADFDTMDPVDSGFARRQAYGPSPRHVYIAIMLVELDRTRVCACATSLHTFAYMNMHAESNMAVPAKPIPAYPTTVLLQKTLGLGS